MAYSKINTLAFLEALLVPLVYKEPEEAQKEILGKIILVTSDDAIDMMKADGVFKPEAIDQIKTIDPQVVSKFETGYLKAIEKYGLEEGQKRMRDRLYETILRNDPHDTRESLDKRLKLTYTFGVLYTKGIHINIDTNEEEN
jgi:hypothetical protein